ncbi:hypothetical protein ACP4OV_029324 [Aristida adscensionis]
MASPVVLHPRKAESRKACTFHPTLWGDFFLTYQPPTATQHASMKERAEVLIEEVRNIVKGSTKLPETLNLIITLQRLGLDYYYETEIDQLLSVVYDSDYNDKDLYVVSLRFYLLRKNGYHVSSDVFLNFKSKEGNFVDADTRSILSLYNATFLRTRGDKILDEARSFTGRCLQDVLQHLQSPYADEVFSSLCTPLFRRVGILEARNYIPGILEARNYIPIYEKEATRNKAIMELAKLSFNLQQVVFCEELKCCTMWWKQLHAKSNVDFVRDRVVETYFWMNGGCYDPPYSLSRIILTKITLIIAILDDFFDTYGSTEECMQLAEGINRWDESAISLLPENMKGFYLCLLETFISFEDQLGPEKSYRVFYLKEATKRLVQAYVKEIKWRDEDYVPETMSEHLQVSLESVGPFMVACAAFVGMGDVITRETFEWLLSYPQFMKSFGIFVRLSNDLVSTKREQTARHCASTVQCYMKEHGTTMQDACQKIQELKEDSWKDMLEQCLVLTELPFVVPRTVLNLSRASDNMYKQCDAYTTSEAIKDAINLLFVEPIPE